MSRRAASRAFLEIVLGPDTHAGLAQARCGHALARDEALAERAVVDLVAATRRRTGLEHGLARAGDSGQLDRRPRPALVEGGHVVTGAVHHAAVGLTFRRRAWRRQPAHGLRTHGDDA